MVGYDGNFVSPLDDHHKCPVCGFALREPMQTECGHRLCKDCYIQLQTTYGTNGDIVCPVDETIVKADEVFPDTYAKREVLNLQTFCKYRGSGCQWKGPVREYENHIANCEFEDVECPNGCGQRYAKQFLDKHLAETCPLRKVVCEFCDTQVTMADLQDHFDVCDYYPIDCKYNCGELKIPRKLIQEHYEKNCVNAEGACSFAFCGCVFRGTKVTVAEHLKKEAEEHLMMAADHASSLEVKNGELNKKLEAEAIRVGNLQERMAQQGEELEHVRLQYAGIQKSVDSIEKDVADIKQRGSRIQENLVLLERKSGPSMVRDIENLKGQARQMEQKVERISQRVAESVQTSKMLMSSSSGPVSLPASRPSGNGEIDKRAERIENQLALQDVQMAELNLKLQLLESTSYNGTLTWKIDNYHRRKQDAVIGKTPSLYSPPFYASRFGYKMCARIYLNGDGQGKGSHISLFFVVMRSEYDALLDWPFPCKITMKLLAQEGSNHVSEAFRPDPNSSSFRRPTSEMNIASGVPLFVSQQKVASGPYVKKDSIFIQVNVDLSAINNRTI
eukprot:Seg5995.2 transcript_id=Seg5995.2/GoldUCD/mRNA.D3Y31 product="TNF receptor-associated factor 3" protein_id=Seg5995.2/GoldUCD/D3Y31